MSYDLRLGDCLDPVTGLASLADKSVDHVICDPPYAARAMKNTKTQKMITQRREGEVYDFGYTALSPKVRRECASHFARIASRWVVAWCDIESAADWRKDITKAGLRYIRTGIWVRVNSCPQFSGDRPSQGVEACVIAHVDGVKMKWNGGGRPATWVGPIVNSQDGSRFHSSPKPLWLMEAQIRDFTDPGDTICDPFAGSATTLVASVKLGRNAIGWERSEKFHDLASKRLTNTREQMALFAEGA